VSYAIGKSRSFVSRWSRTQLLRSARCARAASGDSEISKAGFGCSMRHLWGLRVLAAAACSIGAAALVLARYPDLRLLISAMLWRLLSAAAGRFVRLTVVPWWSSRWFASQLIS
jgi:hypothetical protein